MLLLAARKMIVMAIACLAWLAFAGCSGNHVGGDAGDGVDADGGGDAGDGVDVGDGFDADGGVDAGDGSDAGEVECPEPEPHEEYCLTQPTLSACNRIGSYCRDGAWECSEGMEHPPPMPEFEDWAWRCGVYRCHAQHIPSGEGSLQPGWQEPGPYTPPDPASLTGQWRMVADSDSLVPYGCERQPIQFAAGRSVVVDPHNPDVMYVGLVVDENVGSFWVSGVFKSVDGGQSWFEARSMLGSHQYTMITGHGPSVAKLFIDPDDPQVLFASMYESGLYRTRDGANWWEEIWSLFDCGTPGPVGKDGSGTLYASCYPNLHFSQDGGESWDARAPVRLGSLGRLIYSLGFDRRYPSRVWVGMGIDVRARAGEGYLFLSDDSGQTWTELGQDIDADCHGSGATWSISLCEADPDQMAAAVYYCGLFLSDDGGASWRRASPPLDGRYTLTAAYAPLPDRCRLYASATCDAYHSDDNGLSWVREPGTPQLDYFFFNPYVPEVMGGIVVEQCYQDAPFELWIRE